jgi:pilus assembly protein CpaE
MAAKILVAEDDPNVQRLLSSTLAGEGFDIVVASEGQETIQRWASEQPDLIILDVALPVLNGYQATEFIRTQEAGKAHVPVILLAAQADSDARVRALRSGADDFQLKPFHAAELMARIRSLLARYAPRELMVGKPLLGQVQAYYGAKGGVGTTTIAINTGVALRRELERKVCIIDGNLQFGDHRVFLDLGPDKRSIADVVTASSIDADLLKSIVVQHDSGVDLLLAPPSPETAELVDPHQHHMAQIVETLRGLYDYVVVDIDKRLDENNLDVLAAADAIFVVMTADLSCLKNVRLFLETMAQLNVQSRNVQLVLNRSNAFTGINMRNAEGALKRRIDHQIVNEYRGAISALNSGTPFMANRADSILGRSVLEFARAVDRASSEEPMPSPQLAPVAS